MDDIQFDHLKTESYIMGKLDADRNAPFARTDVNVYDVLGISMECDPAGILLDCYREGFDEIILGAASDMP